MLLSIPIDSVNVALMREGQWKIWLTYNLKKIAWDKPQQEIKKDKGYIY